MSVIAQNCTSGLMAHSICRAEKMLPMCHPKHCIGHVSDSFGATSTSSRDVDGDLVSVFVTGWEESPSGSSVRSLIVDRYLVLIEVYTEEQYVGY